MNDNDIREFFHENRPSAVPSDEFMSGVKRRMREMEDIRLMREEELAVNRLVLLVTFLVGIIAGAGAVAFVMLHPLPASDFDTFFSAGLALLLSGWWPLLIVVVVVFSLLCCFLPRIRHHHTMFE